MSRLLLATGILLGNLVVISGSISTVAAVNASIKAAAQDERERQRCADPNAFHMPTICNRFK